MQATLDPAIIRRRKEEKLLRAEVQALCERNALLLLDYAPESVRIAAAEEPRQDVIAAIQFLSGKRTDIEIWHSEKLVRQNRKVSLPEPVLFPGIPSAGNPPCDTGDELTAGARLSPLPPPFPLPVPPSPPPVAQTAAPEVQAGGQPAGQQSGAVRFVNQLISQAIAGRASDIHIEPTRRGYRTRARIDGRLQPLGSPPPELNSEVGIRLKIIAGLDIAEKRLPQDGQFEWLEGNTRYAVRIATLPTIYGEKIVLRLLSTSQNLALEKSGLTQRQLTTLHHQLNSTQGIILLTGPTGSGKTATLYGCLQYLNQGSRNICSVEDPVEIPLHGIVQTQINPKIELGFATVLRALLRQDPDVIMVGEIRDPVTAGMAIKAAHTGHLVLSTLHTNSPEDTYARLRQLGIDDYFIRSCVRLIIAQRLVRVLCPHCKTVQPERKSVTLKNGEIRAVADWQANGCEHCFSGFYGRAGCFAFLTPETFSPVSPDGNTAPPGGDHTTPPDTLPGSLFEAGLTLADNGVTTLGEIYQMQDC